MANGTTEDEEGGYLWVTNGGCQICDSLDGMTFENEPGRPHPNCNCTIVDRRRGNRACDESRLSYTVEHSGNTHHTLHPEPDDEFDMIFDYEITCPDASTISGQVIVSVAYGTVGSIMTEDDFEDAYAQALELVDDIAARECPACDSPGIV